jgi:hypothetical protein
MSVEYFNSYGGYSVGIPPVPVIDANGNVVSNVLTPTGNVAANKIYANSYYYLSNGQPFISSPGGSNTQLQFNSNGQFGGISNVTWNGNVLTLGDVTAVSIGGGIDGYVLQTDGQGNLSWTAQTGGGGGGGSPGGSNTEIQFNNAGTFGGDTGLTYNSTTKQLHVTGNITGNYIIGDGSRLSNINGSNITGIVSTSITSGTVTTNAQPNITSVGTLTSLNVNGTLTAVNVTANTGVFTGNGSGLSAISGANVTGTIANANYATHSGTVTTNAQPNITSVGTLTSLNVNGTLTAVNVTANTGVFTGNGSGLSAISGANVIGTVSNANYATYSGTVTTNAQPNITSVGTLTSLSVTGNIFSGNNISGSNLIISGLANTSTLKVVGTANINGKLTANGNIDFSSSGNITLSDVSNIHILGGTDGYFLQTDGNGNLTWAGAGGGGNGVPGGSNTQIQYNNQGNFAGSAYFTYDSANHIVQVSGKLVANSMQLGSGSYKFGSSSVYFATTASTAPVVLFTIPVSECSGVDFIIIGTDTIAQRAQSLKISSLHYGNTVNYTEYGSVYIQGGVADFEVIYNPGDVISPPSLDLVVTPNTSNQTSYKMWITALSP